MPEGCCGPVFSTALGLAQIALDPAPGRAASERTPGASERAQLSSSAWASGCGKASEDRS